MDKDTPPRNFILPTKQELKKIIWSFSKKEWLVFGGLLLILFISTLGILQTINKSFMESVPLRGGSIREGVLGSPRFTNPVLALTDPDKDMVALVYNGLVRKSPDGEIIPDLAESIDMSPDGLTYTFVLKENLRFHDGEPLTTDDVIFTITQVQDTIMKSPRKGNWDGVSVEKIGDKTVKFILRKPYATFLENATLGIMPLHIWADSPIELNEANKTPIGSGPYKVVKVNQQSSGAIESYELSTFSDFSLGQPYIKKITLRFYQNEETLVNALETGSVDQASSISPRSAQELQKKDYRITSAVLPRIFGLFFNQSQNQIFTNKVVVKAINQGIDKNKISREVLGGYAIPIEDPIPPTVTEYEKQRKTSAPREEILKGIRESLEEGGWKLGGSGYLEKTTTDSNKKKTTTVLQFSISTGNAEELVKSAELIKEDLTELGMKVDVKTFEVGNLNQSVIRPREYDALFFGQIINNESDLYAFWHSSQRKDPGLNVAMYTNAKVDKILEDAFITIDEKSRIKKYAQFEEEIKKDMPAVFLYSPNFIYIVSKNIQGLALDHIISPADRFSN